MVRKERNADHLIAVGNKAEFICLPDQGERLHSSAKSAGFSEQKRKRLDMCRICTEYKSDGS